jgi:hypothetical protein
MNTGAILNRINFGIAAAANRIPGARVNAIPGLDTLGNAPRAKQVDAVVSVLLGGSASPDTRAVLMSGENPLLGKGESSLPAAMGNPDDDAAITTDLQRPNGRARAARQNPFGRPNAQPPRLTGLAQVVGLAIGSPEFQRR